MSTQDPSSSSSSLPFSSSTAKVVVATTVALSFISFWRGAAIVLSDLASTMFYIGAALLMVLFLLSPQHAFASEGTGGSLPY